VTTPRTTALTTLQVFEFSGYLIAGLWIKVKRFSLLTGMAVDFIEGIF
jgi:hypothetical protein